MIILGFQGCGKTSAAEVYPDKFIDNDFKTYVHDDGWIQRYVDDVIMLEEKGTKTVLCNISKELMDELVTRGISFRIFAPVWDKKQTEEFLDLKAMMFGRYVLRKEQTAKNVWWIEKIKRHYDEWTDMEFFKPYLDSGYAKLDVMTTRLNKMQVYLESLGTWNVQRFYSGEEMYEWMNGNGDLYDPEKSLYAFSYNDAGAVATYRVSRAQAKDLAEKSDLDGDHWSAYLGPGGQVFDEGLEWCRQNYKGNWISTSEYQA